jgi:transglutaminase-like putative cysteine protease
MMPLLLRFVNHFRPREGWPPLLLTLTALLCLPGALADANADADIVGLLVLTILALIAGLRLARSRLSARRAMILSGVLGIGLVVILVGRLVPPPSLLWLEVRYAADWWDQARTGVIGWPLPFATATRTVWQQLTDLGVRLWWWGQTAASGGTAQDSIVFDLLIASLLWIFGLFATWQIYRHRRPLSGLLPLGVGLATLTFFRGGLSLLYLMIYLFCNLWLLAICHLWTQSDRWDEAGTDYPGNMGVELVLTLSPWIVGLLVIGAFFPVIHPRQIRNAFWNLIEEPWSEVEEISERLFGPIEGMGPGAVGGTGSLPRAHLLSGAPELDKTVVFYVTTNDPPPPLPDPDEPQPIAVEGPRRYWRSQTYDTYTGRGWTNNSMEQRTSPSDQPLDPFLPPGSELRQQFELVESQGGLLHAVNAPLQVDHAVQSWWRGPGDLVQMSSDTDRYTVVSRPPEPVTSDDLRAAVPTLPPDLAERYLALPDTIPQRVLELAGQVVSEAETRYDQAYAIEYFLRTYTYTLELPAPPTDSDLVDYFLFEQQEGYCDYYASAMVVLARAAGIPARFATGYAQGTYDHDEERWVIVEKDGHSWVEVYFDGIGWVEFEPTAGLPALIRDGSEQSGPTVPSLPPRSPGRRFPWALLGVGVMLVALVAVVILIWRPRQRGVDSAANLVRDRHTRLVRWGTRLGQPPRDGKTPYEYGADLGEALSIRGQDSRWQQARQASAKAPSEVTQLVDTFVRAQYSPEPISDRESWQIRNLWTRLRRRLWWLWLGQQ